MMKTATIALAFLAALVSHALAGDDYSYKLAVGGM